jgi:hypothetical protein
MKCGEAAAAFPLVQRMHRNYHNGEKQCILMTIGK